jgi:hypothetical protein
MPTRRISKKNKIWTISLQLWYDSKKSFWINTPLVKLEYFETIFLGAGSNNMPLLEWKWLYLWSRTMLVFSCESKVLVSPDCKDHFVTKDQSILGYLMLLYLCLNFQKKLLMCFCDSLIYNIIVDNYFVPYLESLKTSWQILWGDNFGW